MTPIRYCDDWTPAEWRVWIERLSGMKGAMARGSTFEDAMRTYNLNRFEVHCTTAMEVNWPLALLNGIIWAEEQLARLDPCIAGNCGFAASQQSNQGESP